MQSFLGSGPQTTVPRRSGAQFLLRVHGCLAHGLLGRVVPGTSLASEHCLEPSGAREEFALRKVGVPRLRRYHPPVSSLISLRLCSYYNVSDVVY